MTGSEAAGRDVPGGSGAYRAGIAVAALASFLTVWTTIVRDDGNGMGFFMVIMAVGVGWFAAWFRPAGMARTMVGVAVMQVAVGTLIGWLFPTAAQELKPLSTIFLRMIKSLIAPLLFATLVIGIAGHGDDLKRVGRLAWKSLLYFEVMTTIALFIGLGAVHLTKPGVGVVIPPETAAAQATQQIAASRPTLTSTLEHTFPQSFFDAAAKNEVLQVVFFAILFGVLKRMFSFRKSAFQSFRHFLRELYFFYWHWH